jgi:hypothetical protein
MTHGRGGGQFSTLTYVPSKKTTMEVVLKPENNI